MQTIQKSAFPEDNPDLVIKVNLITTRKGEKQLKQFLVKEGAYAFCKMAQEIRGKSMSLCIEKYGASPEDTYNLCNRIFSEFTLWRETIESFLEKLKHNPGYNIRHLVAKKDARSNSVSVGKTRIGKGSDG